MCMGECMHACVLRFIHISVKENACVNVDVCRIPVYIHLCRYVCEIIILSLQLTWSLLV